jgi:hypothetical protein
MEPFAQPTQLLLFMIAAVALKAACGCSIVTSQVSYPKLSDTVTLCNPAVRAVV